MSVHIASDLYADVKESQVVFEKEKSQFYSSHCMKKIRYMLYMDKKKSDLRCSVNFLVTTKIDTFLPRCMHLQNSAVSGHVVVP